MAEDVSNLTVEILKQIRDGISHLETNLGGRIDDLRAEMSGLRAEVERSGASRVALPRPARSC